VSFLPDSQKDYGIKGGMRRVNYVVVTARHGGGWQCVTKWLQDIVWIGRRLSGMRFAIQGPGVTT